MEGHSQEVWVEDAFLGVHNGCQGARCLRLRGRKEPWCLHGVPERVTLLGHSRCWQILRLHENDHSSLIIFERAIYQLFKPKKCLFIMSRLFQKTNC